jgi:hypothetical protein
MVSYQQQTNLFHEFNTKAEYLTLLFSQVKGNISLLSERLEDIRTQISSLISLSNEYRHCTNEILAADPLNRSAFQTTHEQTTSISTQMDTIISESQHVIDSFYGSVNL